MNGKITKSFKFGTFITSDNLSNLNSFIAKEYTFIKYILRTSDGAEYKLDDFTQILAYENHGLRKIKELVIQGNKDKNDDIYFINPDFELSLRDSSDSFYSITYTIRNISEKEIIYLTSKLNDLVMGLKSRYSWIHSLYLPVVLNIPLWLLFYQSISKTIDIGDKTYTLIVSILIAMVFGLLFYFFFVKILLLFPKTVFYIGQQKHRYDRLKKTKSFILYGIIITFIIGVLASILANYLTK